MQPTPLLQSVITGRRPLASRALAAHALMRLQPNLDRLRLPLVSAQFNLLVNKASKVLNRVQKGLKLELNSWSPFGRSFVVGKLRLNRILGDQLLGYSSALFLMFGSFPFCLC